MLSVEEFWIQIGRHNNTVEHNLDGVKQGSEKTNYLAVVCKWDHLTKLRSPTLLQTYGDGQLLYMLLESLAIMMQLEHIIEALYLTQVIFGTALCPPRSAIEDESVNRWFRSRYKMNNVPHFHWSDLRQSFSEDYSGTIFKLPLLLQPVMDRISAPEPWVELI